jgi:hypothetical protein
VIPTVGVGVQVEAISPMDGVARRARRSSTLTAGLGLVVGHRISVIPRLTILTTPAPRRAGLQVNVAYNLTRN